LSGLEAHKLELTRTVQIGELFEVARDFRVQDRHLLFSAIIANLDALSAWEAFQRIDPNHPVFGEVPYAQSNRTGSPDSGTFDRRSKMGESLGQPALDRGSAALEPRPLAVAVESGYERNVQIADKLYQAAELLAAQGAAPFRIAAYRRAADTVCALDVDLATFAAKGGRDALEAVPGIGPAIAGAVAEMLATGRWAFLDHLKGAADPETQHHLVQKLGL